MVGENVVLVEDVSDKHVALGALAKSRKLNR